MPTLGHEEDDIEKRFRGLMQAHESMISQMRGLIVKKTPIDEGAFLDEYFDAPGDTATGRIGTDRPALVQFILLSANGLTSDGYLSIGPASGNSRFFPIDTTLAHFPTFLQVAMVVKPGDVITLNCPGSTRTAIEVMGKVLSGTDWSQV